MKRAHFLDGSYPLHQIDARWGPSEVKVYHQDRSRLCTVLKPGVFNTWLEKYDLSDVKKFNLRFPGDLTIGGTGIPKWKPPRDHPDAKLDADDNIRFAPCPFAKDPEHRPPGSDVYRMKEFEHRRPQSKKEKQQELLRMQYEMELDEKER